MIAAAMSLPRALLQRESKFILCCQLHYYAYVMLTYAMLVTLCCVVLHYNMLSFAVVLFYFPYIYVFLYDMIILC